MKKTFNTGVAFLGKLFTSKETKLAKIKADFLALKGVARHVVADVLFSTDRFYISTDPRHFVETHYFRGCILTGDATRYLTNAELTTTGDASESKKVSATLAINNAVLRELVTKNLIVITSFEE